MYVTRVYNIPLFYYELLACMYVCMYLCMYVHMYSLCDNLNSVLHNYTIDTNKHLKGNIGMLSGYGTVHI